MLGLFTLFVIITVTFFLIAGAPGDPIAAKVEQMPEKAQRVIRAKYGLDQPVFKRYIIYVKNLITTGDFGESIIYTGRSATDVIKANTNFGKDKHHSIISPGYHWSFPWSSSCLEYGGNL